MKTNISNLKKMTADREPFLFTAFAQEIFPEARTDINSFWHDGEITITGVVYAKGQTMEVSGSIKAVLNTTCSLCLEKTTAKMEIPFRQEYQENETNKKLICEALEFDLNCYNGEEIDLEPLVRESLLLEEPLRQLCHPHCRGLCPDCGTNLNITDCGCASKKIDARMSVLEKFLKDAQENS